MRRGTRHRAGSRRALPGWYPATRWMEVRQGVGHPCAKLRGIAHFIAGLQLFQLAEIIARPAVMTYKSDVPIPAGGRGDVPDAFFHGVSCCYKAAVLQEGEMA